MALSPESLKYQTENIRDDRGPSFVASVATVCVFATIAVVLRMGARLRTKVGWGADDYTIVVALLIAWGMFVGNYYGESTSPDQRDMDRQLSRTMLTSIKRSVTVMDDI
jgi:hypothetical protein